MSDWISVKDELPELQYTGTENALLHWDVLMFDGDDIAHGYFDESGFQPYWPDFQMNEILFWMVTPQPPWEK